MQKTFLILGLVLLSGLANADIYSDADAIMNEKENIFMNYFPSHQPTQIADPWIFRYYPETNNYQGINQEDGQLYVMGADFSTDTPELLASETWHVHFLKPDGTEVAVRTLEDGTQHPKLVHNETVRLKGQIPEMYRDYWGQHVEFQVMDRRDPNQWITIKHLPTDENGAFDLNFVVSQKMLYQRDYRIKLMDILDDEPTTTVDNTPITSATLTASTDFVFAVQLSNETKHDLLITIPTTGDVAGTWDQQGQVMTNGINAGNVDTESFRLNAGTKTRIEYTNPLPNQAVTWIAQRADESSCTGSCDQYVVNWDHKPSKSYTACVDQIPNFQSNQTHYVRITPRTLSSSMDLFIWGDNDPLCTAGLDNGWGNFWDNHKTIKVIAEVTAVALGVTALAVTCPECFGLVEEGMDEDEIIKLNKIAMTSDIQITSVDGVWTDTYTEDLVGNKWRYEVKNGQYAWWETFEDGSQGWSPRMPIPSYVP